MNNIGQKLTREEIMEEIKNPSNVITPSMGALRVTKNDGQILLGRSVNADSTSISLMLIGNQILQIPRAEIIKTENEPKSLMYEGLLNGLTEEEVKSLLDYIMSL